MVSPCALLPAVREVVVRPARLATRLARGGRPSPVLAVQRQGVGVWPLRAAPLTVRMWAQPAAPRAAPLTVPTLCPSQMAVGPGQMLVHMPPPAMCPGQMVARGKTGTLPPPLPWRRRL